jgi:hypothetical protein
MSRLLHNTFLQILLVLSLIADIWPLHRHLENKRLSHQLRREHVNQRSLPISTFQFSTLLMWSLHIWAPHIWSLHCELSILNSEKYNMDSGWQIAVNKRGAKRLGASQKQLCLVNKITAKQSGRKDGPLLSNTHFVVYSFSTFEFSRNVSCYLYRCH